MRVKIAPRLARRLGAAEHRHRFEGAEPLEMAIVCKQEFPAPDRPVVAPAQSIENNAERWRRVERNVVFGEARRDMSVMVLRFDEGQRLCLRKFAREFGRQIFRVTIGDDSDWRVIEKLGVERQILAVVIESFDVLQIALMLREDGLAVLDETKGRLELSAH